MAERDLAIELATLGQWDLQGKWSKRKANLILLGAI